jgi:predicted dehydrogenase
VIRSGEIGEVLMYDQVQHELYDANSGDATAWRTQADFPLGRLFDGGHHPIARLGRLFGKPVSVYASGRRLRPNFGEFDHVLMLFEHDNDVRGFFSYGSVLSGRRDYLYVRGTQGILSLERGQIVIDLNDGSSRTIPHARERENASMWRALLGAITEGREPHYTKERALQTLTTLLAIQRSAQESGKARV